MKLNRVVCNPSQLPIIGKSTRWLKLTPIPNLSKQEKVRGKTTIISIFMVLGCGATSPIAHGRSVHALDKTLDYTSYIDCT